MCIVIICASIFDSRYFALYQSISLSGKEIREVELGIDGLKILIGVRFNRSTILDISQSRILLENR